MQELASPNAQPQRKLADALPLLTALGATLVLIGPVLSPALQLYYRDTGRLYYPIKQYIAERLARGELPLWDPWTECGISLLGQISPGIFHPFTLLYLLLPFDLAFKLNHLLALPLAAAGAYWMARKLGTAPWPSAAAGIVYGCCGYLVSTTASNLPYALGPASIPAACASLLWLCERFSAKRLLVSAGLLALCNYSGEPQSALLAGAIGGACALAMQMGGERVLPRARIRKGLRATGLTALWAALALALSMPAVLPGGIRAHASNRWKGLTDEERNLFSLHPARLFALAVPRAFDDVASDVRASRYVTTYWEYLATSDRASFADAICVGIPAILLALLAAFMERRGRWLVLGALVLALASTGTALGIHELLNKVVPGLALFRYSEKLIAPLSLLIALAAARGVEQALTTSRGAATKLVLLCAACAVLSMGVRGLLSANDLRFLEWMIDHGTTHARPAALDFLFTLQSALLMMALLSLALGLISLHRALSPRGPGFSSALACACCFAALLISDADLLFTCNPELLHTPPKIVEEMKLRAGPSAGSWRFYSTVTGRSEKMSWLDSRFSSLVVLLGSLEPQFDALFHIEGTDTYFSLLDNNYGAVIRYAPRTAFALLDVRFVYSEQAELSERQAKERNFVAFNRNWLLENKPQPRAFLLSRVWLAPPDGVLAMFNDPKFDPHQDALVPSWQRAVIGDVKELASQVGEAAMTRISPEKIDVETSAPARRLLVVSEHWDDGWRATIDGQPAPVVTVDALALGVPVPAGSHLVQLRFWPLGFTAGLWIGAGALALTLAFIALERLKRHIPAAC